MKKIIEFIKSLFPKSEYIPTINNQESELVRQALQEDELKIVIKKIEDKHKNKTKVKKVKEYGGKEMYASSTAKAKHEKKENKKVEKKEAPKKKK